MTGRRPRAVVFDLLTAPMFWHDRTGMDIPNDAPPPLARCASLNPLPSFVLG